METDFGSFFDVKDEPRLSPTAPGLCSITSLFDTPCGSKSVWLPV